MKSTKTEIIVSKSNGIAEAKRYLANAKETIAKSPFSETGRTYLDAKYVREGCGIGYLAALKAIDAYLIGKGVPNEALPKSIEEYWKARKKIPQNGKFTESLTLAYQNLHIGGYYQGIIDVQFIKNGLKAVQEIISMMEH
jgi:precorrin-6B methylase 2